MAAIYQGITKNTNIAQYRIFDWIVFSSHLFAKANALSINPGMIAAITTIATALTIGWLDPIFSTAANSHVNRLISIAVTKSRHFMRYSRLLIQVFRISLSFCGSPIFAIYCCRAISDYI